MKHASEKVSRGPRDSLSKFSISLLFFTRCFSLFGLHLLVQQAGGSGRETQRQGRQRHTTRQPNHTTQHANQTTEHIHATTKRTRTHKHTTHDTTTHGQRAKGTHADTTNNTTHTQTAPHNMYQKRDAQRREACRDNNRPTTHSRARESSPTHCRQQRYFWWNPVKFIEGSHTFRGDVSRKVSC